MSPFLRQGSEFPLAGLLLKRRPEPGRYQDTLTFRQVAVVEVL
jgi:hypothetical protein